MGMRAYVRVSHVAMLHGRVKVEVKLLQFGADLPSANCCAILPMQGSYIPRFRGACLMPAQKSPATPAIMRLSQRTWHAVRFVLLLAPAREWV